MRTKDAVEVARVLGNELRLADPAEVPGLLAAVGAMRGHIAHVYPEIDLAAYNDALARAQAEGFR